MSSSLAFRSHRAISTAEMASEATPGRPRLRQALLMASLAFGTPSTSHPSTTPERIPSTTLLTPGPA